MLVLTSLNFAAMVLFCLAMTKHREVVLEQRISNLVVKFFKPLAWTLLTLTAYLSTHLYGWSIGPALFFGSLTVAILALILLLTYQVKKVPLIAIVLPLMASISMLNG